MNNLKNTVRLRIATFDDARQLWEWRNEDETRAASFSTKHIPYNDHIRWFEEKLNNENIRFLIALDRNNRSVGYARLDLERDTAEINLTIDKMHRGKGLGSALIQAATEFALNDLKVRCVVAHTRINNDASVAAFHRAGFVIVGTRTISGVESLEMIYEKNK